MLYKLKEKWNRRHFVILAVALLALLSGGILFLLGSLYNRPSNPYGDAYYFLIKGAYIPVFFVALVDIIISVIRKLAHGDDYTETFREMKDLLLVAAISLVVVFQSPITFGRFALVLCDIPNMITDTTRSVRTREFNIQARDEKKETSRNTFHEYHYYAWIDGEKYLVSKNQENENFNRMVDDYMEDERSGRPQKLDPGWYEITYLPVSRCITKVVFSRDGESQNNLDNKVKY